MTGKTLVPMSMALSTKWMKHLVLAMNPKDWLIVADQIVIGTQLKFQTPKINAVGIVWIVGNIK